MKKEFRMQELIRLYNVVILLIVFGIIMYINLFALRQMTDGETRREQDILDTQMTLIDQNLENNTTFVNNLVGNNLSVVQYMNALTEQERYYAANEINQRLSDYALMNYGMNEMFFYSDQGGSYKYLSTNRTMLDGRNEIRQRIIHLIESYETEGISQKWILENINDTNYLIYFGENNGCFSGCYCTVDYLLGIHSYEKDGITLFLTDGDGVSYTDDYLDGQTVDLTSDIYESKENHQSYHQVSTQSGIVDLYLVEHIETSLAERSLISIRNIMVIVSVILLLSIFFMSFILNHQLYQPVRALIIRMLEISEGNFETEICQPSRLREIRILNDTFNRMVKEIKHLKIGIYEEKIREQEITLQYLQEQIKPHFLVNALNSVYSMAEMKDSDSVQRMCLYLVNYFRYLYQKNQRLVLITDELKHAEDYAKIQKMRMPGQFKMVVDLAPECSLCLVPPLMIKTFVENSLKYGISLERRDNYIHIQVRLMDHQVCIKIRDGGPGFPPEVLESLNHKEQPEASGRKSRVGIYNVLNRMRLVYGEEASLYLSNENGACVDICIPMICE